MNYSTAADWDEYRKALAETDPEELIMVATERYQAEVLGEVILTGGDVVSIMQSMAVNEDLRLKNKGGCVQILADHPRVKKKLVLRCETEREGPGKLKRWQKKVIREDQARNGKIYGNAG